MSLVSKTGESLAEIDAVVADAAAMVREMAASASEQSDGLEEITSNVGNLDRVTQDNVAMFEETNAATQLLAEEVTRLGQITLAFRTEKDDAVHSPDRLAS